MLALRHIWIIVTDVAHSLFGSPFFGDGAQYHFGGSVSLVNTDALSKHERPIFTPPGSNIDNFVCNYTRMAGFRSCGTPDDRSCWLRNKDTGEEYNISTDYETKMPQGITRRYHINVTDGYINANGLDFYQAKIFNNTWPGPLIEACWGDEVEIHVHNKLNHNGTSIHWHGIRQNQTMHMDGVNGITQCPIAPQSHFIYKWNATQYGTSWYHSHYSVQYADGLQAPITIHGPTSFPYDKAIEPITVTDWANTSAFENLYQKPAQEDILLGGLGNINRFTGKNANTTEIPRGYEIWFDDVEPNPVTRAKRYLLRLVNTAFDTTFVFSIDNHNFTVVEADFVPVKPFNATSILIAIGQRYHVIVEATPVVNSSNPSANPLPSDGNYWIRTWIANGCGPKNRDEETYMKTGILRYDNTSTANPNTKAWDVNLECSDTVFNDFLEPVVPWTVGDPSNGKIGEQFNVDNLTSPGSGPYATSFFSFERPGSKEVRPFQTSYGNPTFLNLDNVGDEWPNGWVVVPENYTATDWIHLHGHDFAIVQQENNKVWNPKDPNIFRPNKNNPPRRDVVLLPENGFAVIAFKTDNPGVWLMHCHIADHASTGLSLQIMERQTAANDIWPPGNSSALDKAHTLCASWNSWAYDCKNYWPGNVGNGSHPKYPSCEDAANLQNDSGV
ncbi:laccase ARB_05828 [Colletotrichum spaethianum]|uniref:Laccase ARB_05828 n=1 Tax=Colletotrichum spaethianum TaxID=700344 RepID=A0AA37LD41_9PEZI|nr:laccase ARB_05828 [Colletotrichum spaethianum]GKT46292.1 laccase ARB_05828 [Colletotrichum spaethianum]